MGERNSSPMGHDVYGHREGTGGSPATHEISGAVIKKCINTVLPLCLITSPMAFAEEQPSIIFEKDTTNKSYAIPAAEIVGFDFLLNQFNRHFSGSSDYDSNLSTLKHNLHHSWVVDNDPFEINQFLHPYQGSMYHGFARSAGLSYWESAAYTFAGSVFWEEAGEKTPPSKNDQVASGIAGSFVGEALFRMANLVLEKGNDMSPFWRNMAATAISPSTGFNRLAFGDRFANTFASRDPAYFSRLNVGVSSTTQNIPGTSTALKRHEAIADFSLDYGLPGKRDYSYKRPFDYFSFQATGSSANTFENIMTRGLLFGKDYHAGSAYQGLWGLYGSYDYISPQFFRISSTALSLGTTAQLQMSDSLVLQGTGLLGVGYSAVGSMRGNDDKDYHYGVSPQTLLALRLIMGNRAFLDFTGREYFVSGATSAKGGHENITRADVTFTVRVHNQHGVSLKYVWSRRDATFPDLGDKGQTRGTVGVYYTLLGNDRMGVVDWGK